MQKKLLLLLFGICLMLLIGCSNKSNQITEESTPDKGIVKGTLHSDDSTERIGLVLYLGDVITDSNGMSGGFLKDATSPVANFDSESGDFIFTKVEPGEYSFIIKEVVFGGQLLVDESGNARIIYVKAGETTDMGIIEFKGF